MWLNVIQVKYLGPYPGTPLHICIKKITKKLSGQNWKSHPSMVLGILSQIYLEKISAVCLCTPYKLRVHPRNQKPRIKIAESSRKKVDSWFLVSMDVRVYTGRWLSECFWPNVQVRYLWFSQDVGIIDVHGFSYLCFCHFLNSHGLCNTVLWWDVFFAWVLSWFYFFKEVQFSDKERSFQSKVHYSFQKLKMLVTEVSVLF